MREEHLQQLEANRAQIRRRWEALLRIEPVNSPLLLPDALIYLFDQTFSDILHQLHKDKGPVRPVGPVKSRPGGDHLLGAYFLACEQAMTEALVLAQAGDPGLDPATRDAEMTELVQVVRRIAWRDIRALEGACLPGPDIR